MSLTAVNVEMLIWYTLLCHYLSHLPKLPKIHQQKVYPQPASALATLPLRTCRFSKRDSDKTALPCPAGDQHEAKKSGWSSFWWLYLSYIIFYDIRTVTYQWFWRLPLWSKEPQKPAAVWVPGWKYSYYTPKDEIRVPWTKESSGIKWHLGMLHLNLA